MNKVGGYQKMAEEQVVVSGRNLNAEEVEARNKAAADYPLDQIPPDFDLARLHEASQAVGRTKMTERQERQSKGQKTLETTFSGQICGCCARQVPGFPVTIGCHNKDYSFLGTGLPLYFEFIKTCILMLMIMFVTSGDYNIITNMVYGTDCAPVDDTKASTRPDKCALTWVTQLSLANKRNSAEFLELQQMLNLVSMVTLCVIFQFYRKAQRELDLECDEETRYASDYTILVRNIPTHVENLKNGDFDDDLKEYFTTYINSIPVAPEVQEVEDIRQAKCQANRIAYKPLTRIVSVNLIYRLEEQRRVEKLKEDQVVKKQAVLSRLYSSGVDPDDASLKRINGVIQNEELNTIQVEIDKLESQLEEMEKVFIEGKQVKDLFLGAAFVTFQWEADVQEILRRNVFTWTQRTFQGKKSELEYRNAILKIESPPEPTDVFWENLHVTAKTRNIRKIIGYIITLLMLTLCAGAIYYLTDMQQEAVEQQAAAIKAGDLQPHYGIKAISIAAAILITLINYILATVIDKVCQFEQSSTQTGYNISLASRSSMAQFTNTALITFLINQIITKNTFGNGGLIYNQTYVLLNNMVVPAIISLLDAGTISKWIFKFLEERKGKKSIKTQLQLNQLYEKPIYNISVQYATVLKNMYVIAFYSSIIPLGLLFSVVGLLLHYWVEKFNIARRRTIKYNYSSDLSIEMTEQLEFILPIYCLTNLYWQYAFTGHSEISKYAIAGVAIGFLNAILPMQEINEILFPLAEAFTSPMEIYEAEEHFLTDYQRENPATAENARAAFTARVQKHKDRRRQLEGAQQIAGNIANQMQGFR